MAQSTQLQSSSHDILWATEYYSQSDLTWSIITECHTTGKYSLHSLGDRGVGDL